MADQFVIVPAHAVSSTGAGATFEDPYAAAVKAADLVAKDRVPRAVVQVMFQTRERAAPAIDIIQVAQISRTAGVSDG